jgi:hypothetical protein
VCGLQITWTPGDEAWDQNDALLQAPIGAITAENSWKQSLRSPQESDKKLKAWQSSNVAEMPLWRHPKFNREGIRASL